MNVESDEQCCEKPTLWECARVCSSSVQATLVRCGWCEAHHITVRWDPPPQGWVSAMGRHLDALRERVVRAAYTELRPVDRILAATSDFRRDERRPGIDLPETRVLLARLHDLDDVDGATIVPGLEEAWQEVEASAPTRRLLSLFWLGGGPGASTGTFVRAHELERGVTVYTVWSDYPHPGVFLIGKADIANDVTDARILEALLTSNGARFGLELFGGPPDEIRSSLSPELVLPLLVEALDRATEFDWMELVEGDDWEDEDEGDEEDEDRSYPSQDQKAELLAGYMRGELGA